MIQANARYAREVTVAVRGRDLPEINRIIDSAKLTRREFSSVCKSLDLTPGADTIGGTNNCDKEIPLPETVQSPMSPTPHTPGTEIGGRDAVETGSGIGPLPTFFLDAEGPGGTTALALATIQNDTETVRRLIKGVSETRVNRAALRRVPQIYYEG